MKIENTPEAKARFFALYWGQLILFSDGVRFPNILKFGIETNEYLELTPLSQISDEDAEWVIGSSECNLKRNDTNHGCYGMSPSGIFMDSLIGHNSFYLGSREVDYLRLKGYAVKWVKLPVSKQIEYGWVKLKEK